MDSGPKTRQEREWDRRHRVILDAAAGLFTRLGYNGTTVQMIADEAEFSVGYLYKHFPGKQELLEEIVRTQFQVFEATRRRIRREHAGSPLRALREELARLTDQLENQAHLLPLVLMYDETSPSHIKARMLSYRRQDAELLRQAMDRGEIRRVDPELAAATLDGMVWGLIRLLSENDRMDQLRRIPSLVDDLLLAPLAAEGSARERKDRST